MRNYILNLILFLTLFSINTYSSSISSILDNIDHTTVKTVTITHCAENALCLPEYISVAKTK